MGLADGGISFRSYFVDGEIPDDFRPLFLERIKMYQFEPLEVEAEEDISYGWVHVDNLLETRFERPDVYFQDYLVLALRIDKWSIPPALLKAAVKRSTAEKLAEADRAHLSKMERGELADRERTRLKRMSLPSARSIDFCWNLTDMTLRFSSSSRSVNEMFCELFERTFNLNLVPQSPYMACMHCGISDDLIGALADIEPAQLL
ncbi:MAG: hypothetical protein KC561_00295 [Myxococcales bacterium]|nr:hypothetical protein [Myxococcales bacterium]